MANFRAIEAELYNIIQTKREHEIRKKEILYGSPIPREQELGTKVQENRLGDVTTHKVMRLLAKIMQEEERRIKAIEYILRLYGLQLKEGTAKQIPDWQGDEAKRKLVQLKYFDRRYTDRGIMEEIACSPRAFYKWRREFVQLIADELGWEI